jgi:hypothetical protein
MLSHEEVKTILAKHNVSYTDEEIKAAMQLINTLVDIQLRIDLQRSQKLKTPWKK